MTGHADETDSSPESTLPARGVRARRALVLPKKEPASDSNEEDAGEVESSNPETPTPQPRGRQMFVLDDNAAAHLGCSGYVADSARGTVPVRRRETDEQNAQVIDPTYSGSNRENLRTKIRTTGVRDRSGSAGSAYPRDRVTRALEAQNANANRSAQRHATRGPDGRFIRKPTQEGEN